MPTVALLDLMIECKNSIEVTDSHINYVEKGLHNEKVCKTLW